VVLDVGQADEVERADQRPHGRPARTAPAVHRGPRGRVEPSEGIVERGAPVQAHEWLVAPVVVDEHERVVGLITYDRIAAALRDRS